MVNIGKGSRHWSVSRGARSCALRKTLIFRVPPRSHQVGSGSARVVLQKREGSPPRCQLVPRRAKRRNRYQQQVRFTRGWPTFVSALGCVSALRPLCLSVAFPLPRSERERGPSRPAVYVNTLFSLFSFLSFSLSLCLCVCLRVMLCYVVCGCVCVCLCGVCNQVSNAGATQLFHCRMW